MEHIHENTKLRFEKIGVVKWDMLVLVPKVIHT